MLNITKGTPPAKSNCGNLYKTKDSISLTNTFQEKEELRGDPMIQKKFKK